MLGVDLPNGNEISDYLSIALLTYPAPGRLFAYSNGVIKFAGHQAKHIPAQLGMMASSDTEDVLQATGHVRAH